MRFRGTTEFITCVEELLEPALCEEIVARFYSSDESQAGQVLHADEGPQEGPDKVSLDLPILPEGAWADVYPRVHGAVSKALETYLPDHPSLGVYPVEGTGYKIQMYPEGRGRFEWHFDALSKEAQSRLVALIIYLNDVERGGETEFYYQRLKVAPSAGLGILFPTAWTHMHRGNVPVSTDKLIISSFLRYRMD